MSSTKRLSFLKGSIFTNILVLAIAGLCILMLNHYTPMYADDYNYSYSFSTGEKLRSIAEIPDSMESHYQSMNGRIVVHGLAQCFLLLGRTKFDILNTAAFLMLALLICYHAAGSIRAIKSSLLLMVLLGLWFCVPAFGQSFLWTVGAANYLYGILIILIYLVPYRRFFGTGARMPHVWWKDALIAVPSLVGGMIAGATNENTGVALVVMLLLIPLGAWIQKRGVRLWMVTGVLGSVLGVLFMLTAPGQQQRLQNSVGIGDLSVMLQRFGSITFDTIKYMLPLWIALAVFLVLYHSKQKDSWKSLLFGDLFFPAVLFLGTLASMYSMVASPAFPERAWSGPVVLCLATLGSVYVRTACRQPAWRQCVSVTLSLLTVAAVCVYSTAWKDVRKVTEDYNYRVWYMNDQREQGNMDVETYRISAETKYSPYYHGMDLFQDPAEWPNVAIAQYYGLNSVCQRHVDS